MKKLIITILILFPTLSFASIDATQLVQYHNIVRTYLNVQPLALDPALSQRATSRAETMVGFSHAGWIKSFDGTPYYYIGENLGIRFDDSYSLFFALWASPTHLANMISPYYQSIGIGINNTLTVILYGGN